MRPSRSSLWMLALAGLLVTACGSTYSSMTHSWVDPTHGKTPIKKVLVIGLAQNPSMRRLFETQMLGIFQKSGVEAVPSFDLLPNLGTEGDEAAVRDLVRAAVIKSGADAVTVTRLVSAETSERWVEGSSYVVPEPYYGGFYHYYYNSYSVVNTPGYLVEDKTYVVETNLYDVTTEKLVWTGISETLNPESSAKGLDSLGRVIVSTLRKEGLIAK
jgi:hypothetical protein